MEKNKTALLLKRFNETIEKWITYLDDYTLIMLQQQPNAESWSLGQVYVHIVQDTQYFIGEIKASLALKSDDSEKEMHEYAKAVFQHNEFPDMFVPNPSNSPGLRQPASKAELLQSLQLIKEEINQLCAQADFSAAKGKTEHPGLHFFNALEWLQFAEIHMRHHLRQKSRIDAQLFPQLR